MTVPEVMDIEDYTCRVVQAEMPASWPKEALAAQSIAARTYALATHKHDGENFDVCTRSGCCQGYAEGPIDERIIAAVKETEGIIGLQDGQLRVTYYAARCGGHTDNSWGPGWLKSVWCPCASGNRSDEVLGHKQGLCQYGAYYLAVAGYTWEQILNRYYALEWVRIKDVIQVCEG